MNQIKFDRHIVDFLLTASESQQLDWYNQATDAELAAASLSMDIYAHALEDQLLVQTIDQQIEQMPVLLEAQVLIAAVRP